MKIGDNGRQSSENRHTGSHIRQAAKGIALDTRIRLPLACSPDSSGRAQPSALRKPRQDRQRFRGRRVADARRER